MSKKLPKPLQNKLFSYQEALAAGLTRHYLNLLVKNEVIIRVDKGLYITSDHYDEETKYQIASKQVNSKAIVCLLSALEYYNLIDEIVSDVWLMVEQSKRTNFQKIRLLRKANLHLDIGIMKKNKFLITSLERTLVECLIYQRLVGSSLALEALKKARNKKLVKVSDLRKIAVALKKEHLVKPYLEMLID